MKKFALGVGLTNACDLACAHCYRAMGTDQLSLEQVLAAVDALPTRAVNFGTGENGLHPQFAEVVEALVARGIDVTMTTNGLSARVLPDATLARFRDVEFSIDYPSEVEHDAARGPGNWKLIEEQMDRCRRLGVRTCIVTVMMSTNWRALPDLARLAAARGALLRVNVYQAVRVDAYTLTFEQFWEGWRALFAVTEIVACGEPVLRAALGLEPAPGAGCGVETVRLTPRAAVVPCVYAADDTLGLADLARLGADIVEHRLFTPPPPPDACGSCPQLATCAGGCAARRSIRGSLGVRDPYCPFSRPSPVPLEARFAAATTALPKAASACTTIVRLAT